MFLTGAKIIIDLCKSGINENVGENDNMKTIVSTITFFTQQSHDKVINEWAKTETGQRYLAGERITDKLYKYKDSDPDCFGKVYLEFIKKYKFDQLNKYVNFEEMPETAKAGSPGGPKEAFGKFVVDCHDFTHVLSGYAPSSFGEVLRIEYFTDYESRGWKVIRHLAKVKIFLRSPKEYFEKRKLFREARELGRAAENYTFWPWFDILGWHINKVRKNFNTHATTLYHYKDT